MTHFWSFRSSSIYQRYFDLFLMMMIIDRKKRRRSSLCMPAPRRRGKEHDPLMNLSFERKRLKISPVYVVFETHHIRSFTCISTHVLTDGEECSSDWISLEPPFSGWGMCSWGISILYLISLTIHYSAVRDISLGVILLYNNGKLKTSAICYTLLRSNCACHGEEKERENPDDYDWFVVTIDVERSGLLKIIYHSCQS